MLIESVSETSERLTNILLAAILAGEAIDHIRTSTTDVLHAVVLFFCVVTDNMSCFD